MSMNWTLENGYDGKALCHVYFAKIKKIKKDDSL